MLNVIPMTYIFLFVLFAPKHPILRKLKPEGQNKRRLYPVMPFFMILVFLKFCSLLEGKLSSFFCRSPYLILLQAQSAHSSTEIATSNPEQEQKSIPLSTPDVKIDRVETSQLAKSPEDEINQTAEISTEHLTDNNNDTVVSDIADPGAIHTDEIRNESNDAKAVSITDNNIEIKNSFAEDDSAAANSEDVLETSSFAVGREIDSANGNHHADTNSTISPASGDVSLKVDRVRPESETEEAPNTINGQETESGPQPEPPQNKNKRQEIRAEILPKKIQDQLDEVSYLIYKNFYLNSLLIVILDAHSLVY